MNRIEARFQDLRKAHRAALIPFLTAGDPDRDTTLRILARAEACGADLIELGIPFSDPIADGPVIQESYHRVLQKGQRVADAFELVRTARQHCPLPIVLMISYSLVFKMGFERFLELALSAGADGATIPDLPVDEAQPMFGTALERDFCLVCFVTPATTEARRRIVAQHARGFIYYISVRGITGERDAVPPDLPHNLKLLRAITQVPVAVGFGISTPQQARAVAALADGVIVGSAIVKRMAEATRSGGDPAGAALAFIQQMATAVAGASPGVADLPQAGAL